MVFNKVRDRVDAIAQEIRLLDSKLESKIANASAKGKVARLIMSYQFMFNLAAAISDRDNYCFTSLYMIKYNLGELNHIR